MTFTFGVRSLTFFTSKSLERYTSIKEWDHGYLVMIVKELLKITSWCACNSSLIYVVLIDEIRLNFLRTHLARHDLLFGCNRRRDTCRLADAAADGHDAVIGMGDVGTGDIASGQKKTVNLLGNQTAVGNRISLGL